MRDIISLLLLTALLILSPILSLAQPSYENDKDDYHEYIEDPYMPPSDKSINTSKSFGIVADNFFCTQVNIDSLGRNVLNDAANEPSIGVNPQNPDEIIIAWRQFDNVQSNFRQAGYAYTTDGGITWINKGPLDEGKFRSDPVIDTDGAGRFYFNSLRLEGEDNQIINDVFRSEGIGNWDTGTYAFGGDKQWMIVEKSVERPNIYGQWVRFQPYTCDGNFSRSVDGGISFEDCMFTASPTLRHGTLAFGPNNELYLAGKFQTSHHLNRSSNAFVKDEAIVWDLTTEIELRSGMAPAIVTDDPAPPSPNPGGLLGQIEIDTDLSDGPHRGNIYVVATHSVEIGSVADVVFARSTDGGISFEAPRRINSDRIASNYQWFGTMSVAPNGRIDVIWLDTRDNPGTNLSALYYGFSTDGGVSWSENQKLSPSFDPHLGWPNQSKMGDYFDMVSVDEGAHIAWTGTFTGGQDVYYGFVTPREATTSTYDMSRLGGLLDLKIMPNPAITHPTIELSSRLSLDLSISLFDSRGSLISNRLLTLQGSEELSFTDLLGGMNEQKKGIFLLRVTNKKYGTVVKRIVML